MKKVSFAKVLGMWKKECSVAIFHHLMSFFRLDLFKTAILVHSYVSKNCPDFKNCPLGHLAKNYSIKGFVDSEIVGNTKEKSERDVWKKDASKANFEGPFEVTTHKLLWDHEIK